MAEFLLMPFGSAGDTFPFIGLGLALRARGHTIRVAGNGYFRPQIKDAGLEFDELYTKQSYLDTLNDANIWHPTKGFAAVVGHPMMPAMVEDQHQYIIEQFVRNPNIILVAGSLAFGARIARETHGLKLATVHMSPSVFLSVKKPPRLPTMNIPSWMPRSMVRMMYWVANRMVIHPVMKRVVGVYRKELGLPKLSNYFKSWIHSRELVLGLWPSWFAEPVSDWPVNTKLMDFPFFDSTSDRPLRPEVMEFIQSGKPPIVVTFGSAMKVGSKLFAATVEACQELNRRAILLTPFVEQVPEPLPAIVKRFDYLPLSKLLPHAGALVNHGGIGTVSQGLRAGVPQVVTPLAHDQFDNAARVERLGAGTVLRGDQVTFKRMTAALQSVLDRTGVQQKCAEMKRRLASVEPFRMLVDELELFARRLPSTKYWV